MLKIFTFQFHLSSNAASALNYHNAKNSFETLNFFLIEVFGLCKLSKFDILARKKTERVTCKKATEEEIGVTCNHDKEQMFVQTFFQSSLSISMLSSHRQIH